MSTPSCSSTMVLFVDKDENESISACVQVGDWRKYWSNVEKRTALRSKNSKIEIIGRK